jgi:hypothetical protein
VELDRHRDSIAGGAQFTTFCLGSGNECEGSFTTAVKADGWNGGETAPEIIASTDAYPRSRLDMRSGPDDYLPVSPSIDL